VTFQVEITDIWIIESQRLEKLVTHTNELAKKLEKTKYEEISLKLRKEILDGLNEIAARQEDFSVDKVSPVEHVGAYEKNLVTLEKIKEDIGILENLVTSTNGDPGEILGKSSIGVKKLSDGLSHTDKKIKVFQQLQVDSCLVEEEMKDTEGAGVFNEKSKVIIPVEIVNPSNTEPQEVPVSYFLPEEVRGADVVDPAGLEMGYDFSKERYYVYKDNITLPAGDRRVFEVVVRDKWMVDKAELLALKIHAEKMVASLEGMAEFRTVREIGNDALKNIYTLLEHKGTDELTKEYVARYRSDVDKFQNIKKDLTKMEEMLNKAGVMPEVTIVDEEILCEEMRAAKEKKTTVQKKELQTKGLEMLAQTIFQGKAPDVKNTWKIIFAVICFLGLMSVSFFALWSSKVDKEKKFERLNKEIKASKNQGEEDNNV